MPTGQSSQVSLAFYIKSHEILAYRIIFLRDFLTTVQVSESQKSISTAVHALFGDVSSHLSHFYLSS